MRPIRFRGFNLDWGKYFYGFFQEHYTEDGGNLYEIQEYENAHYGWCVEVEPETVAQFLGYDRNGAEIYSDDIVREEIIPESVPIYRVAGDRIPVNMIGQNFPQFELAKKIL